MEIIATAATDLTDIIEIIAGRFYTDVINLHLAHGYRLLNTGVDEEGEFTYLLGRTADCPALTGFTFDLYVEGAAGEADLKLGHHSRHRAWATDEAAAWQSLPDPMGGRFWALDGKRAGGQTVAA